MTETSGNLALKKETSSKLALPAIRTRFSSAGSARCIVVLRQKRQFDAINLHLYHYAGNNPVRYSDPTGMAAWDSVNTWSEEFIQKYSDYVNNKISEYQANNDKFTCEDFALSLLIDFASENSLPVSISNGTGTYSSSSDNYNSIDGFKNDVLSTTSANDLMSATLPISVSEAQPGDLILMDTGLAGGTKDGIMNHTQVITINVSGILVLRQGNIDGGSSKYSSLFYGGQLIQGRAYDPVKDIFYGSGGTTVPGASSSYGMNFRRWNFSRM